MKREIGSLAVALAFVMTAGLASAEPDVALVSVGHGIPGDDLGLDPALPVDIIVDDACLLQDFKFGDFAGPLELPPGTYSVAVALSDGDAILCGGAVVIGPVDLDFAGGDNVTIFAHLTDGGGITASVFDNDASAIIAGKTRLTVRHTANAPAVDIALNRGWMRGPLVGVIEDLTNPNQAGPLDLRPGSYAVTIFPADTLDPVFQVQPFVTKPGVSQLVYAVGSLTNETFTLLVQNLELDFSQPRRAAGRR